MELTSRQRDILTAVVDGYQTTESPVTGDDIDDAVEHSMGTIRNEMQGLKALDLVEAIPGRRGGYAPTVNAYDALDRQADDDELLVVAHGYDRDDVVVDEIDFLAVNHPTECRARLVFRDPVSQFDVGDPVVVGPTPRTGLVVAGEVLARDEEANALEIAVTRLEAPVEGR